MPKFYLFVQNNSGGYFIKNKDVDVRVYIEALNAQQANSIFDNLDSGVGDYCECCGSRWSLADEEEAMDEPSSWCAEAQKVVNVAQAKIKNYFGLIDNNGVIIHYLDGTKKKLTLKTI